MFDCDLDELCQIIYIVKSRRSNCLEAALIRHYIDVYCPDFVFPCEHIWCVFWHVSSQVSTAGSGSLLGSASSLPLGFGMLGGLVPVSLPFQFPPLLNLPPLGTAGSSTAASGAAASSNASFSTLTQSEWRTQGTDTALNHRYSTLVFNMM